ncbi:hypothetical protein CBF23_012975 [Marinomonas agarivorans]|nr:hypothetical protein CBF23_012975 [Marinomonas agarivorans]
MSSVPHAISLHAQLQPSRGSNEVAQYKTPNQDVNQMTAEKQQAMTTPSTFVSLSEESKKLSQQETRQNKHSFHSDTDLASGPDTSNGGHTKAEQREITLLRQRDQEVKIHERAHAVIGGQYASAPTYTYEKGPDGRRYATDGEVNIDLTPIPNDPQATIDKMEQVYRAALAPAQPSSQDRIVAAEARQTITSAKAEQTKTAQNSEGATLNFDEEVQNVTSNPTANAIVDKKTQHSLQTYQQIQPSSI